MMEATFCVIYQIWGNCSNEAEQCFKSEVLSFTGCRDIYCVRPFHAINVLHNWSYI